MFGDVKVPFLNKHEMVYIKIKELREYTYFYIFY